MAPTIASTNRPTSLFRRVCARAQMADMIETRGSLAVVALHGKVYALGGGKPGTNLDTIEARTHTLIKVPVFVQQISCIFCAAATCARSNLDTIEGVCRIRLAMSGVIPLCHCPA